MNKIEEKMKRRYDSFLLLYESSICDSDDMVLGIYTDITILIEDYQKLSKRKFQNYPLHVYGFKSNTHNADQEQLSLEELKIIANL